MYSNGDTTTTEMLGYNRGQFENKFDPKNMKIKLINKCDEVKKTNK